VAGKKKANSNGANVGYEAELWRMADALRYHLSSRWSCVKPT
jgi:hypothetical protein